MTSQQVQLKFQCLKSVVIQLSQMTKKFTGQPVFGKIESLVARRQKKTMGNPAIIENELQ